MTLKSKILIYLLVGSILASAISAVYAAEISEMEYITRETLKGNRGLNFNAQKPSKEELNIEEHICIASEGKYCEILINLAKCESSLNKDAIHVNNNGTVDMGLYQINSIHKDITNSAKFDVYAATRWTVNKIEAGQGHIWVCWNKI